MIRPRPKIAGVIRPEVNPDQAGAKGVSNTDQSAKLRKGAVASMRDMARQHAAKRGV